MWFLVRRDSVESKRGREEFTVVAATPIPDGEHVLSFGQAVLKTVVSGRDLFIIAEESVDPQNEVSFPSSIFGDDNRLGTLKSNLSLVNFTLRHNSEEKARSECAVHFLLDGEPNALVEWHDQVPEVFKFF